MGRMGWLVTVTVLQASLGRSNSPFSHVVCLQPREMPGEWLCSAELLDLACAVYADIPMRVCAEREDRRTKQTNLSCPLV